MYLHSNSDSYHSSPSQSPPYHKQKHIQQAFHRFGVQVRPNQTVSQFKKSASLKIGLFKTSQNVNSQVTLHFDSEVEEFAMVRDSELLTISIASRIKRSCSSMSPGIAIL